MMSVMEWTGEQQLFLLLQSGMLGVVLGVVFDFCTIVDKCRRRHRWMAFLCDILFFVLAAFITFFFSLAVMDGRMHPLLFVGSGVGILLEHWLIGRYSGRWIYRFFGGMYRLFAGIMMVFVIPFRHLGRIGRRLYGGFFEKISKKPLKMRKNPIFFRKKS